MGCQGIPLVEPVPIQDVVVTGVAYIETLGDSCARVVMFVDHVPTDGSEPERHVVCKVVIPHTCLPKGVRKTMRYMADKGIEMGKRIINRALS